MRSDGWSRFLEEARHLIDRELPEDREELAPLRRELESALTRLRPPEPVDRDALRDALKGLAQESLQGQPDAERARDLWASHLDRILPGAEDVEKVVVAVHGIGDQSSFGTVQRTAHCFCRYMGLPAVFPLGRFHGRTEAIVRALVPTSPPDPKLPHWDGTPAKPAPWPLAFAEIYWADIPRKVVEEGYTLEEAKQWARTLVERLRDMEMQRAGDRTGDAARHRAYEHFERVIDDMIESVTVIERLLRVAKYAGLGEFRLKQLLADYLNDVQAVTEFYALRRRLLDVFAGVMRQVRRSCPDAKIYIVAHSEGTVVAFLGLLEGIEWGEEWVDDVEGLMTIGSPLNKHVLLWRDIFDSYKAPRDDPQHKITWHNYYESGDPIAYNLGITYDWMTRQGGQRWDRFFEYDPRTHDHGYSHSAVPGEAHNNYWRDDRVFGHFISNVVDPEGLLRRPDQKVDKLPPPSGDRGKWFLSYFSPYFISTVVLMLGSYLLYKAVRVAMDPSGASLEGVVSVSGNVAGLTALVAGTSAFALLPRLIKRP